MKCEYCGAEIIGRSSRAKYCSSECCRNADKRRKNERNSFTHVLKKCEWCGEDFTSKQLKSRFCSHRCASLYVNLKSGRAKTDTRNYSLSGKCTICGNEFEVPPHLIGKKKYCSAKCKSKSERRTPEQNREAYLKKHPNAKSMEDIQQEANRKKIVKQQKALEYRLYIEKCRKKKLEQEKIKHHEHKCVVCGNVFITNKPNQVACSSECSKVNRNRISHKRKKRYKEITVDSDISLFYLAKRDEQQCQICGLFVDWTDKTEKDGTIICGDYYPSIDHVKPISLGGLHSWDNVQLAHRKCNYMKSNKYIG